MTWPLELVLCDLGPEEVAGTLEYGPSGVLPVRMRRLSPEAADSFRRHIGPHVVCSDMFRSGESSLVAVQRNRGALPPAFSGHNYGECIDLDIRPSILRAGFKVKTKFDAWMAERGWYCHRRDSRFRSEAWHYNHLGPGGGGYLLDSDKRTSFALERLLTEKYGAHWVLTPEDLQRALASLRFYGGAIDGDLGPLSVQAIKLFQAGWCLKVDGIAGKITQRTLAYVTALRVAC